MLFLTQSSHMNWPARVGELAIGLFLALAALALGPAMVAHAATITVTSDTDDPGLAQASLRSAIQSINNGADANASITTNRTGTYGTNDEIRFAIAGSGTHTIQPASALPIIVKALKIDGYTQSGASANTKAVGTDAVILVEIDGQLLPATTDVLRVGHTDVTLRGLTINRAPNIGINIQSGSDNTRIVGCYIGTDVTGTLARANQQQGIVVSGAANVIIGGTDPADRNVVSGNTLSGVLLQLASSSGSVLGNYIGTNAAGTVALGNGDSGIIVSEAPNATIGGTATGAGNLLSGNVGAGAFVLGLGATNAKVQGNFIGVTASGMSALGNVGAGVSILAPGVLVGGTDAGAGNVISGSTIIGDESSGIYGRTGNGIIVQANESTIQGNFIGTNATGTAGLGNARSGISIQNASNVTVGGTSASARNVVSGNGTHGILVQGLAYFVKVQGNYVGLNAAGTAAIGNAYIGIDVINAPNALIGGTDNGAGNVVSGTTGTAGSGVGIAFQLAAATGGTAQGNRVGTSADGTVALPNALHGILIFSRSNVTVGGTTAGAPNIIANNLGSGIVVVGNAVTGNTLRGNSIFANGQLGIDLNNDGLTANDTGDGDTGGNNLQNYPVLTAVAVLPTATYAAGTLNSTPSLTYDIDLYGSPTCDSSGHGEGQTYLGSTTVTTDGSGNGSFAISNLPVTTVGSVITATATDPGGNTSELSACRLVAPPGFTTTPGTVSVAEGAAGNTFTVALNSIPTSVVTVTPSFVAGQVGVSPASLTFQPDATALNPQSLTVTAVDNHVVDGPRSSQITFGVSSADAGYNGLSVTPVTVNITDDDTAGFTVTPTSGLTTTEAGGTATFTVRLNTIPTSAVTIPLTSSDLTEGTVSPSSLTFQANASALNPQTVTITGVDDALSDGDVAYTIVLGATTSSDPFYNGLNPPDVAVTNKDDDIVRCSSRPNISVTSANNGDGRLRVTVTASTTAPGAQNRLVQLQFDAGSNVNVQLPGQTPKTGPFVYDIPNQPTGFVFYVGRLGPGATHLPFRVVDGCPSQPWPTFVGGGPTAF